MDSDEGELVIDEGLLVETNPPTASPQVVRMEIADTSQDESNGATSAQSETNSSETSTEQRYKRRTKDSQKSPRHSKQSSSSSHRHSSSQKSARKESSYDRHNNSSHKSHDRSKEHRTHIERDKKTSSTSHETPKKDKKSSQTNWFKLTHLADYKSKELNVSMHVRLFAMRPIQFNRNSKFSDFSIETSILQYAFVLASQQNARV